MPNLQIKNNKLRFFFKIRTLYFFIFLILSGWSIMLSVTDRWTVDRIQSDVIHYYSYLPATFICKDVALKNNCEGRYWPVIAPNGGRVFKVTMGMSLLYLPFFTIAHVAAPVFHEKQDGYSDPYQKMILLASLCYALLGLIFTFRSLKIFFSEQVAIITSLLLFFSTNLFYYTTIEPGMTHSFSFGLCSVFIYLTIKWHERLTYLRTIAIGLILGLMILIRPTSILFFMVFLFYNIKTKKDFFEKLSFFLKNYIHALLLGLCIFIMLVPQMIYWKYVTGNWIYYSYGTETFFWKNPHIIEGLFSFRKGWFIYTPIMFIACIGIFYLRKYARPMFLPLLIFLPIFCYVMLSWWSWYYGGSFGQRVFVDIYPLMAFPLAGFVSYFSQRKILKTILTFCCLFFVFLNCFQTWQLSQGIIHFASMTRESYWLSFAKTKIAKGFYQSLWDPDDQRASQGKSEYFEPEELYGETIAIQCYNLKYLSSRNLDTLQADTYGRNDPPQSFKIIKTGVGSVSILASNHKYVGVDKTKNSGLYAQSDTIGESEKFHIVFLKENYINLISSENKYVRIDYDTNLLVADSTSVKPESRLRVFFVN